MRKGFFLVLALGGLGSLHCVTTPPSSSSSAEVEGIILTNALLSGMKPQIVNVVDPNQSQPGKPSKIGFKAYDGLKVMDRIFGDRQSWAQKPYLSFECADGYRPILETKEFLRGQFYFAFARSDQKDFSLTNYAKDGKKTSLAPFYLVWTNPDFQNRNRAHYWPYQVVKIHFE